jgi:hypothetical protein
MLVIESNSGGILVNLKGIFKNGMWNGIRINNLDCNMCICEIRHIIDFVVRNCFKKVLEYDNIGVNCLCNLDRTYFLIRRDDKHTRKYYIRKNINCKEYDIRKGRDTGYYCMGLAILRDDLHLLEGGEGVIIDWIQSYYKDTGTAKTIIDILEQRYKIALIPTNITIRPYFWDNYLKKRENVSNLNDFVKYLWNYSEDIINYYNIAYDVSGYELIYEEDEENIYLRLLYDY